jgi:UDP-N-acetylmuramoyl-tripeptide--D-alanyl-D-alanine ligase
MRKPHDPAPRPLTLGDLIAWSNGVSHLGADAREKTAPRILNDSRMIKPGDVFVAIATDKNDGHRFVGAAFAAGAAAAIVDKRATIECTAGDRAKLIAVADPLAAVQRAAARYRREIGCLIIGVTGSSGKTTTRRFIAAALGSIFPVCETWSNWNNHLGVPLSILRFKGDEWAGVIEMGANHTGEISVLSKIARPDIAVVTNIGYAHAGLFGTLSNTARAKFEILDGLNKKEGFLLANGDDKRVVAEAKRSGIKSVYFGCSRTCSVHPDRVRFDPAAGLDFEVDGYAFHLNARGRHFLYSALPAIYLGRRCGVPDEKIASSLAAVKPLDMRGAIGKKKRVAFIVDCYNANPSSMKSAIEQLVAMAAPRRRMAVVGDMLELGRNAPRLHRELGTLLVKNGVRKIVAVGEFADEVAKGAVKADPGMNGLAAVKTAAEAVAPLHAMVAPGDIVLLKGSRGVHLETVYENF